MEADEDPNDVPEATLTERGVRPRDATNEFGGSVGRAMTFFNSHPHEYVKIYSNSKGEWFANPADSNFYLLPETALTPEDILYKLTKQGITPRDATSDFGGSVGRARVHLSSNPYEYIKIYSNSQGKWYANPSPAHPTNFILFPTTGGRRRTKRRTKRRTRRHRVKTRRNRKLNR